MTDPFEATGYTIGFAIGHAILVALPIILVLLVVVVPFLLVRRHRRGARGKADATAR
jgi:hypothetical protein